MRLARVCGVLLAGLLLVSLSALGQEVHYNYDRAADFTRFKTYRWLEVRTGLVGDQLVDQEITSVIENELAKKGLEKVQRDAGVMISYQAAVGREKQLNAWGSGPRWGGMGQARMETIQTGSLVVDFYNPGDTGNYCGAGPHPKP